MRSEVRKRTIIDKMVEFAEMKPGFLIIDVGCGTGSILIPAAKKLRNVGKAFGVDLSETMLNFTNRRAKSEGLENVVRLRKCSALELPFDSSVADVLFCGSFFHEVIPLGMEAVRKALSEFVRVTKKNGKIVIYDFVRCEKCIYVPFHPKNTQCLQCLTWLLNDEVGKKVLEGVVENETPIINGKIHINVLYEILRRVKEDRFDVEEEIHFAFTEEMLKELMQKSGLKNVRTIYRTLDSGSAEELEEELSIAGIELDSKFKFCFRAAIAGTKS